MKMPTDIKSKVTGSHSELMTRAYETSSPTLKINTNNLKIQVFIKYTEVFNCKPNSYLWNYRG